MRVVLMVVKMAEYLASLMAAMRVGGSVWTKVFALVVEWVADLVAWKAATMADLRI